MFQFYGDLLEFYKVMILFIKERFETISIWCLFWWFHDDDYVLYNDVLLLLELTDHTGIDGYKDVHVRSREDQEGRPWFFPFTFKWTFLDVALTLRCDIPGRSNLGFSDMLCLE